MKIYDGPVIINISEFFFAPLTEINNQLTYGEIIKVEGPEDVTYNPTVSTGELYGGGKKRKVVSKKNGYELGVNHNGISQEIKSYIEGTNIAKETGVESGSSKDEPGKFACGWTVEKTEGHREMIWFPYCQGKPIERSVKQSEANTNFSNNTLSITALEHASLGRYYTMIDSENEKVKSEDFENFFTKVQTTDTIEKGTIVEEPKE